MATLIKKIKIQKEVTGLFTDTDEPESEMETRVTKTTKSSKNIRSSSCSGSNRNKVSSTNLENPGGFLHIDDEAIASLVRRHELGLDSTGARSVTAMNEKINSLMNIMQSGFGELSKTMNSFFEQMKYLSYQLRSLDEREDFVEAKLKKLEHLQQTAMNTIETINTSLKNKTTLEISPIVTMDSSESCNLNAINERPVRVPNIHEPNNSLVSGSNKVIVPPGEKDLYTYEFIKHNNPNSIKSSSCSRYITNLKEFRRTTKRVFQSHPGASQLARFNYLLNHTVGMAHQIVSMFKCEENSFELAWKALCSGEELNTDPIQDLAEEISYIPVEPKLKNLKEAYSALIRLEELRADETRQNFDKQVLVPLYSTVFRRLTTELKNNFVVLHSKAYSAKFFVEESSQNELRRYVAKHLLEQEME